MPISQSSTYIDNLTIPVADGIMPLKFVYHISNYANMEKQTRKEDNFLLSWPILPLECVLPECSSAKAEQLIHKELGLKIKEGNN